MFSVFGLLEMTWKRTIVTIVNLARVVSLRCEQLTRGFNAIRLIK